MFYVEDEAEKIQNLESNVFSGKNRGEFEFKEPNGIIAETSFS